MPTVDLRMQQNHWVRLREQFAGSLSSATAPETGAIGVLGECRAAGKREFLIAEMLWPQAGDFKIAANRSLVFDASYIRRAHLLMRRNGLAGLVMFHTHPLDAEETAFSWYDDGQEPELLANLRELEPRTRLLSIVAGRKAMCGRMWECGTNAPVPLRQLVVTGDTLSWLTLSGCPERDPPPPAAIFDRGLALTGSGALARLGRMSIAVVGASGTGSLMCELLARAGCRRILLVDPQKVEDVNLNRILYATAEDERRGAFKVDVLQRAIDGLELGCSVVPIRGNVLQKDVLAQLREADLVFGCVDKAYPRWILCKLAAQYLLPYIDVGSEIGADPNGIVSLDARVSYVCPGRPCLVCTGVVTSRRLSFESLSSDEQQRVAAQGYSDDLLMTQPAVMDLNMRAASLGVMVLRHLLQPFLLTPLPIAITENLVIYKTRAHHNARADNPQCPICRVNPFIGYGDCAPA